MADQPLDEDEDLDLPRSSHIHLDYAPAVVLGSAVRLLHHLARPQMSPQGIAVIDDDGTFLGLLLNPAGFETLEASAGGVDHPR